MKVMKFGGTSIGKPERMEQVAGVITKDGEDKIIVLSALSGTTGVLRELNDALSNNERRTAKKRIDSLQDYYTNFTERLLRAKQEDKRQQISSKNTLIFSTSFLRSTIARHLVKTFLRREN